MPVNDRFPLAEVLAACEAYYARRRRQVFVEYLMLAGVNDRYEQAVALAGLLDPRVFKVNLIPYNPTGSTYDGSSRAAIDAFRAALEEHGLRATVRLTRGRDIDAACGQLAAGTDPATALAGATEPALGSGRRSARPGTQRADRRRLRRFRSCAAGARARGGARLARRRGAGGAARLAPELEPETHGAHQDPSESEHRRKSLEERQGVPRR